MLMRSNHLSMISRQWNKSSTRKTNRRLKKSKYLVDYSSARKSRAMNYLSASFLHNTSQHSQSSSRISRKSKSSLNPKHIIKEKAIKMNNNEFPLDIERSRSEIVPVLDTSNVYTLKNQKSLKNKSKKLNVGNKSKDSDIKKLDQSKEMSPKMSNFSPTRPKNIFKVFQRGKSSYVNM